MCDYSKWDKFTDADSDSDSESASLFSGLNRFVQSLGPKADGGAHPWEAPADVAQDRPLRFAVGDAVDVLVGDDQGRLGGDWRRGVVAAVRCPAREWPPGARCPYRVTLESGGDVACPRDDDSCVRCARSRGRPPNASAARGPRRRARRGPERLRRGDGLLLRRPRRRGGAGPRRRGRPVPRERRRAARRRPSAPSSPLLEPRHGRVVVVANDDGAGADLDVVATALFAALSPRGTRGARLRGLPLGATRKKNRGPKVAVARRLLAYARADQDRAVGGARNREGKPCLLAVAGGGFFGDDCAAALCDELRGHGATADDAAAGPTRRPPPGGRRRSRRYGRPDGAPAAHPLRRRRAAPDRRRARPPPVAALPSPRASCPISMDVMREPVVCACGNTFERSFIAAWLTTNDTSPVTGEVLPHKMLVPNHSMRSDIQEWHDECKRAGGAPPSPTRAAQQRRRDPEDA
ncbi:ubiquitin-protein transferase [Aureococcus anophagefferens]|uniref:Ubiquitin-protein transferase n=1 Tax=Aureococcus anophagefferens TaxID=44056 RepID=A0ABR1FP02_AURAN